MPALPIADEFAVQQGLSSSYELAHIKTWAALSSEPVKRLHVDWVKVSEGLLQFVRGRRGIHHEALGLAAVQVVRAWQARLDDGQTVGAFGGELRHNHR